VLSTLVIVLPAIWGGFALWYQIPGGRIFKGLCVVFWGAFSFAMLVVLWQGRIMLGVIAFTVALPRSATEASVLDETSFAEAATDPEFMRKAMRPVRGSGIEIGAYGVVCIESGR